MLKEAFNRLKAQQFRRPSGLLGLDAANFMRKNNQDYIARVCDILNVQDDDTVLEIGCGAGYAVKTIAEKNSVCRVDAIDFSPMMLKRARKNVNRYLNPARVRIFDGKFGTFGLFDTAYSKIFAINVIYFWDDLSAMFSRVFGLLKPGGYFVIFMSSPERLKARPFTADKVFNKYPITAVREALLNAGFLKILHETVVKGGFDTYYIVAQK